MRQFVTEYQGGRARVGIWGKDEEESSSNWKEFTNVILAIKEEVNEGNIFRTEVFIFTHNSTVEGTFNKGSSPTKRIFELVLELQKLEHELEIVLHVFWVSGEQMKKTRDRWGVLGRHEPGRLKWGKFLSFVPLNRSALEAQPELKK